MRSTKTDASRPDPRDAVRRDESRLVRRERDQRHFWHALGVLGMVGWPIALGSVGGTWLGRWLDLKFGSGIRFTLLLMMVGICFGCAVAWKTISQKQ